nr:hypothetical protein [Lapillicoccus sp.]
MASSRTAPIIGADTDDPSALWNVPGTVAVGAKGSAHGALRWIALTSTMRFSSSRTPFATRSGMPPLVAAPTQALIRCRAPSASSTKSTSSSPAP